MELSENSRFSSLLAAWDVSFLSWQNGPIGKERVETAVIANGTEIFFSLILNLLTCKVIYINACEETCEEILLSFTDG